MRQIWVLAQNTIKALVRKKDFYVFLMMLCVLFVFLLSENFFGVREVSRYIKDIGFFCLWLFSFIIATIFSAKQLPEELESKAVFSLLAKPVARAHLLVGRFLGSLSAASLAYTIFYLLYVGISFLKGEGISPALLIQAYILGICFLSVVCAISILLTVYLTLSAAITLSFIIYFAIAWFADRFRDIVISSKGLSAWLLNIAYYLIPHYEFYDMRIRLAHSWEPIPLRVLFAIVIYTMIYASIVLYLSLFKFKKKIF